MRLPTYPIMIFGFSLMAWFVIWIANKPKQNTDHLYNAYSPLYRDMYVVKTDSVLSPTSWYFDPLIQDSVIIISEYKPQ